MYGGTRAPQKHPYNYAGLSPRVRGNPYLLTDVSLSMRSIPACTGEPFTLLWGEAEPPVYPRVYGGTYHHQ